MARSNETGQKGGNLTGHPKVSTVMDIVGRLSKFLSVKEAFKKKVLEFDILFNLSFTSESHEVIDEERLRNHKKHDTLNHLFL